MKNILFLSYVDGVPNNSEGGSNHVIYDFVQSVQQNEFEFDFLSTRVKINSLTARKLNNVEENLSSTKRITYGLYYRNTLFKNIVGSDLYMPFHFLRRDRFINRYLEEEKYRIIHSHDSIGLSFTGKLNKAIRIMTIHSVKPLSQELTSQIRNKLLREKYFRKLQNKERLSYELADVVTFPSKAVRSTYLQDAEIGKEKEFRIIYNGIDIEKVMSASYKEPRQLLEFKQKFTDLVVLNVASHVKHKRIDVALEVIRELVHKNRLNVCFVNLGVGDETGRLKRLAKDYQIEKNVKFLGLVDNQEVLNWMKASDILLHVSEKVVFDLVVLEAMACGLCVVASNEGGNKEIITNGFDGYLLDQNNAAYIAQVILKADRNKARENAYKTIRRFSIKEKANEYYELYKEYSA